MFFSAKKNLVIVLTIVCSSGIFGLDLTDLSYNLADKFYSLTGNYEGTTGFRSLLIPSGGRAESLGNAYTGLADDISYIDFNPAASSILENTEISLFHNSWIADSAMETIAATTRIKNLGLGGKISCFYVPFSEYDSFGTKSSSNYYTETTAVFNVSHNFHPGYIFKGLAVGSNIKFSWRGMPDYSDKTTGKTISGSGLEQSALAFMADIGIITQFNFFKFYNSRESNCRAGVSFSNLGAAITGFGGSIKFDDPLTTSAGIGFSYKPLRPLTFSFEFRQPFDISALDEYQIFYAGTGFCADITSYFSILCGFQLKGANPRFSLGSEFEIFKMRFNLNYSLDLTSSLNPINRISVSAKIKLGDKGRKEIRLKVDELYSYGLSLYAERKYDEAIIAWQEALKLDKYFDPAREAIEIASQYSSMLKLIQDLTDYNNEQE